MSELSTTQKLVPPKHCVMIPFLNRHEQVARCVGALLTQEIENTEFLLIDDGSTPQAIYSTALQPILSHPNVNLIHHKDNYGVSAARNSGIDWCRKKGIEIVIMVDSDCFPDSNVIHEHLRLHAEHPHAACIGGRIVGEGRSLWAKLDGITSWIHASPHQVSDLAQHEFRQVEHPYHLATTNFSVKLDKLPPREKVFEERLISGEDCFLIRELRRNGQQAYFSSTPRVFHQDREKMMEVFRHHYEWGHHQYFIQLGGDLSPRCFNPLYRLAFTLAFLPLLPVFALIGAALNSRALWRNQKADLWLFPLIYLLWLGKGIAVVEAAIRPQACLKPERENISYELWLPEGQSEDQTS